MYLCSVISCNIALISRSVHIAGDTTNRFLNENWREAFKMYKNLPEEAFGILFRDLTNKVLRHFPYKELFPE
jgi:GTP-sensing pleiotropic transcriptional regulator CodY